MQSCASSAPAGAENLSARKVAATKEVDMELKNTNYQSLRKAAMDTVVKFKAPAQRAAPAFENLRARALELYALPLNDLLFEAHTVHREHFAPNRVQRSTLLSIKTGGCPEDCGYCPQAARYHTGVESQKLLPLDEVVAGAHRARRPW